MRYNSIEVAKPSIRTESELLARTINDANGTWLELYRWPFRWVGTHHDGAGFVNSKQESSPNQCPTPSKALCANLKKTSVCMQPQLHLRTEFETMASTIPLVKQSPPTRNHICPYGLYWRPEESCCSWQNR